MERNLFMKDVYKLLVLPVSDSLYRKIASQLSTSGNQQTGFLEQILEEGETGLSSVKQKENVWTEEAKIPVSIFVKDRDYFRRIEFCRIRWVEASGSYSCLNIDGASKLMLSFNLSELSPRLPCHLFMRVHRSYIVNINYIDSFIGNMLCIGTQRIPVSKRHKREVITRLNILGNIKDE